MARAPEHHPEIRAPPYTYDQHDENSPSSNVKRNSHQSESDWGRFSLYFWMSLTWLRSLSWLRLALRCLTWLGLDLALLCRACLWKIPPHKRRMVSRRPFSKWLV